MSKDTKFKPGQSGNPSGRPKLPGDIVKAKSLNRVEAQRILNQLVYMSKDEIKAFMKRPDATMLELLIGSIIFKGVEQGDHQRTNFLFERLIGKVKDDIEVTHLRRVVKKLDGTEIVYTNEPDKDDE